MPASANIARHLPEMARIQPQVPALKVPRGRSGRRIDYLTLSFAELDAEADGWAHRLRTAGVTRDQRVLVMVKQGLPLIAVVFALFKLGAVPVVIDPGMGMKSFLRCVRHTEPHALVGIGIARFLSHLFREAFQSISIRVSVPGSPLARVAPAPAPIPTLERDIHDLAAILFTSGSTGAPKGVCYEHGMFSAQVEMIRRHYQISPGEIDLPMLPIFALFNPALGMTTVVPEIDPRRPAKVDAAKIVQAIHQEGITNSFGSPTLWDKITAHCIQNQITLPSLRRVLCAGAPVPGRLWERSSRVLTGGCLHSPYGSTESLPVTSISGTERISIPGSGTCVGKPLPNVRVNIIPVSDDVIKDSSAFPPLPSGTIGEIVATSPSTTREYHRMPQATALSKFEAEGVTWHRMGDLGYLDEAGVLWFCGRKAERVYTAQGPVDTEPVEQVFRRHPAVNRCAVVGVGPKGSQIPVVIIEPLKVVAKKDREEVFRELREMGLKHPATASITHFLAKKHFPVDVRHNAKIHRLSLAKWAAEQDFHIVP